MRCLVPCADGGLWLTTPVDVLLVLLPLLEEGREQAGIAFPLAMSVCCFGWLQHDCCCVALCLPQPNAAATAMAFGELREGMPLMRPQRCAGRVSRATRAAGVQRTRRCIGAAEHAVCDGRGRAHLRHKAGRRAALHTPQQRQGSVAQFDQGLLTQTRLVAISMLCAGMLTWRSSTFYPARCRECRCLRHRRWPGYAARSLKQKQHWRPP